MPPLPPLRSRYRPANLARWQHLLLVPLFRDIAESHRRWVAFERERQAELVGRSREAHAAAWTAWPDLAACERRLSPLLAKSFRLASDRLHPDDACDAIFISVDDIDDTHAALMTIETQEGFDFPDNFDRAFPDARPYREFVAFVAGAAKARPPA